MYVHNIVAIIREFNREQLWLIAGYCFLTSLLELSLINAIVAVTCVSGLTGDDLVLLVCCLVVSKRRLHFVYIHYYVNNSFHFISISFTTFHSRWNNERKKRNAFTRVFTELNSPHLIVMHNKFLLYFLEFKAKDFCFCCPLTYIWGNPAKSNARNELAWDKLNRTEQNITLNRHYLRMKSLWAEMNVKLLLSVPIRWNEITFGRAN